MSSVENDAMLVIIHIGGILPEPRLPVDGDGQDPVILPGRMVQPTGITLVFGTKLTLGVAGLGGIFRGGDALWLCGQGGVGNAPPPSSPVALLLAMTPPRPRHRAGNFSPQNFTEKDLYDEPFRIFRPRRHFRPPFQGAVRFF